jgi:hypothetical protein
MRKGIHCIPSKTADPITHSFQIVPANQDASLAMNTCIPRTPSTDRTQLYAEVFFAAVGYSPVLLQMFSALSLSSLITRDDNNGALKETVSVLGGLYAVHNPHLLPLDKSEKQSLHSRIEELRRPLSVQLGQAADPDTFYLTLLRALLLSFVEVRYPPVLLIQRTCCKLIPRSSWQIPPASNGFY